MATLTLSTLCQLPTDQPLPDALRDVVHEIMRRIRLEATEAEAERLLNASIILSGLRFGRGKILPVFKGVGLMQEELAAYDEALIEGGIRMILRMGRKHLGKPDAATEAALKSIQDLDRLDRMADAVLSSKSWQEVLDIP